MGIVQELRMHFDGGGFVEGYIEEERAAFGGECYFRPETAEGFKTVIRAVDRFSTADDCFEWIVQQTVAYATARNMRLAVVDNPCNAPFADRRTEQAVLKRMTVAVPVTVNGR